MKSDQTDRNEEQMIEYGTRMRKERDRYRALLLEYGDHADRCSVYVNGTCYCGWEELQAELKRRIP